MTRHAAGARSGADRWLVSYADLMTLLLAFFATMYAMSEMSARKADAAAAPAPAPAPVPEDAVARLRERLAATLSTDLAAGRVELDVDARGVVLSLPERATFPVGSPDITADADALLTTVARTVAPLGVDLRVEGHTDDTPMRTARYSSNWELSTARASAVVALFIERGLEPARLSAAGYGEFHPRVPNQDATSRARNRRVDLVVMAPDGRRSQALLPASDAAPASTPR